LWREKRKGESVRKDLFVVLVEIQRMSPTCAAFGRFLTNSHRGAYLDARHGTPTWDADIGWLILEASQFRHLSNFEREENTLMFSSREKLKELGVDILMLQ
jgi:hypothetical protein